MLEGRECYPTTLDSAFIIMLRRKADKVQGLDQDVAFTTVASGNGRMYNNIKCHNCNQGGTMPLIAHGRLVRLKVEERLLLWLEKVINTCL